MPSRLKLLTHEMKHHAPYTLGGAVIGIFLLDLSISQAWVGHHSEDFFEVFHPAHVFFSAITTTALFRQYAPKSWVRNILVGILGSIGIGTLSDCLIPFWGEMLVGMEHAHMHIGFIEEPLVILSAAALGVGLGFLWPRSKFNHGIHVFLSTAATLFHVRMATESDSRFPSTVS